MKHLKYLLGGFCLLLSLASVAQELPVFKQAIVDAKNSGRAFYEMSNVLSTSKTTPKLENAPRNVRYFNYNTEAIQELFRQEAGATEYIILLIKSGDGHIDWTLELAEVPASFYTHKITTSSGEEYTGSNARQRHYRGYVKGRAAESLVSISFYEDQMMGIVSIAEEGNYNLGKLEKDPQHAIYRDLDLPNPPSVECGTNLETTKRYTQEVLQNQQKSSATTTKCVDIYLETEYDVYQIKGNVNSVANHILGVFNQTATIYANENINMRVSQLHIWTTIDPYTNSTLCPNPFVTPVLQQFQNNTTSINGDLGQLLTFRHPAVGIAASFNGLCAANVDESLSFASIGSHQIPFPTFSWAVYIMSHELGHLLGSRHTHACVWNGNNTAIDGCGSCQEPAIVTAVCSNDCNNCPRPPAPTGGGTIMSYCHQNGVGINFSLGFGTQPGNVIRNSVANAACVNTCQSCALNLTITLPVTNGQTSNEEASNAITASNIIHNGAIANYQAGNIITLIDGFHGEAGSEVSLRNAPCNGPVITTQRTTQQTTTHQTNVVHNHLQLYPNPTKGTFTVSVPLSVKGEQSVRIGVYNLMGVAIMDMEVQAGAKVNVDLNGKPKGIYLVKYFSNKEVITQKVIYK
ncbi:hypothetical protein BKI52_27890 [marine bacterium AO1-C]|nr:hypothetical protein BKI52_27890 [marine bacterium AO1-C]